jgi:serine/threonine protein kinase
MKAIHEQGLVHRDLFPRNVFVTSATECKVGDYGLARTVKWDKSKSPDKDHLGVAIANAKTDVFPYGYTPEQMFTVYRNKTLAVNKQLLNLVSFKSDVWHYGVLLFEWHLNIQQVVANFHIAHQHAPVDILKAYSNVGAWLDYLCTINGRPAISHTRPDLCKFLMKVMDWDPAQRPMFSEIPHMLESAGDFGTSFAVNARPPDLYDVSSAPSLSSGSSHPPNSGANLGVYIDGGSSGMGALELAMKGAHAAPHAPGPGGRTTPTPQGGRTTPNASAPVVGTGRTTPNASAPVGTGRTTPTPQRPGTPGSSGPNALRRASGGK